MARRKAQEPCEYCESDFYPVSEDGDDTLVIEVYPGHMISASAIIYNPRTEEQENMVVNIPCNYCPNCGRKLTEM